ncbi:type I restriction enzyme, S subunit [Marinobacter persicus]|uniref:Type I restriction enzyme, S subunit n=1 Tax=Marinobacter persicus TaxID=930118 RepID=A0A1I3T4K7_9GAMM|nr:restriction endonuclease subunit S [Marinobacter persicus]GHD40584.1 type I restriction-modification enzyme, S subunit [Marinobacter persicus]SFJ64427.1 type I restriction enzyme, S subunit [Marinobacter persicus]
MNKDVMGVQEVSPGYEFVAENPAVPVGYKQTEVGAIPEDWEVAPLGDCLVTRPGYGINAAAAPYSDKLPTYIRITDISEEGRFKPSPAVSVRSELAKHYYLSANDIVFARTGASVGKSYLYRTDDGPLVYAGFLIRVTPDQLKLNSDFLAAYVTTGHYWQWVRLMSMRSGQPGINGAEYSRLPVPLPSLDEQRAIATALSDVDALLEELDRLIAKKRDIKQAAMQQLLSGETRLPGFEGEWEQVELGEVTERCTSGATPYRGRPDFYKGNIRWISSGELNYGVINDTDEHISLEAVRSANLTIHPAGTFLMAITGLEAAGTRGTCGIVGKPSATNQSCMAIYPTKKLDTMYLFHYYVFRGDALAFKYCQGTKQQSYTAGLVRKLPISLPPSVEEQRAIAANLSDIDAEIQALEQRRSKTAELKQGMMQELLTGRTRLV